MKFRNLLKFITRSEPDFKFLNGIAIREPYYNCTRIDHKLKQISHLNVHKNRWEKFVIRYEPKIVVSYISNYDADDFQTRCLRHVYGWEEELPDDKSKYYLFKDDQRYTSRSYYHSIMIRYNFDSACKTKWSDIICDTKQSDNIQPTFNF